MRFVKLAVLTALALSLVVAAPVFARTGSGRSKSSSGQRMTRFHGLLLAKPALHAEGGAGVSGVARFHDWNSHAFIGVHAAHIPQGESWTAAAYDSKDCSGTPAKTAGPAQGKGDAHGVIQIDTTASPTSIHSAAVVNASGKTVACATMK